MCTTIFVKSPNGLAAGRTMEFASPMNFVPVFIPRNFNYRTDLHNNQLISEKAFIGTTIYEDDTYAFFDGINEEGLIGCANYFAGDADYPDYPITSDQDKVALRSDMFISYILATCSSIADIKKKITSIYLYDLEEASSLPVSLTFHFAFYDKTGEKIIIEPLNKSLKVIDNPVGVMTNSPDFQWHLTNLRNYVHIQSENKDTNHFSELEVRRFGEGSGLLGIPGDFTPPSRFVRAANMVSHMPEQLSSEQAVTEAFHILSHFDVPEGTVYNSQTKLCDTTHYTAVMDNEKLTYNVSSKADRALHQVNLNELDLEAKSATIYELPKEQTILSLKSVD
ncbi:choloylglycine hydrolase family protein [Vagococcus intermedius]|uniref:Choloylglycine hydrolase family protein n=1 Tax=Vagococcus intermedius TaxID=2991418 RepID=A0AAF0CT74_9ENTE|nr:choloylglycine hydrolase family protein [Vagococcus intermedius]WEG72456.1 choloylglycine hydrolase family protein [Vagococcus intermedius]WEG74543.1 choloylglycine hydrolase family protein [Vagococcus intermedius]